MNLFDVYSLQQITITEGKGAKVWDDKGVEYLDLYGGHAVISIGHSHPHYISRIKNQLEKIGFYSNSVIIPLQEELATKLGEVSGKNDYRLFLCNSGAEANENAMKLASFHTGRKKIVAFSNAFHGRTSLAVAATDNPSIIAPVNETENIHTLPFNDEEALEAYFSNHGNEIAAVIIEGIQGVGGIRTANKSFIKIIRKLCDEYGALYIADEVQCGYGRSGKFFSADHYGIAADIYTMAKGMGNGFPLGGILIAPQIKPKKGMLGTTFGGNHLACAAGLAVVEVMQAENLIENAAKTGTYMLKALSENNHIQNVRGKGLMIGFDLPDNLVHVKEKLLTQEHIFTGAAGANTIRLLPSLALSLAEADQFIQSIHHLTKS